MAARVIASKQSHLSFLDAENQSVGELPYQCVPGVLVDEGILKRIFSNPRHQRLHVVEKPSPEPWRSRLIPVDRIGDIGFSSWGGR